MKCTDKERQTCNVEKMGCEGCYYNEDNDRDINKLIEELTNVRPDELSAEGLKLFNKINEIIDKNKELEESNQEKVKMLTEQNRNLQISYDSLQELFELRKYKENSIPVFLVEEKIEEINKLITEAQKELGSASKEYTIYVYQKDILQELLEKRK